MFTSDNGPAVTAQHPYGSAGPLRDKKGYLTEGGIRVPGIVRWPGKIKPGSTSDEPVCGVDFLPTVCELTGIKPPADRTIDGASIMPVFSGGSGHAPRAAVLAFQPGGGRVSGGAARGRLEDPGPARQDAAAAATT